jgi:hypothetical protein
MAIMSNNIMYSNRGENEWRSPSAIALQNRFHNKADDLFSLGKLHKRLCVWMKEKMEIYASQVHDISRFLLSPEYEFARMILRSRAESLGEIKKDVNDLYPNDNPLQLLYEKRENLIDELLKINFVSKWGNAIAEDDSWQIFARHMPWHDDYSRESIRLFFRLIGKIGIMTDVLCQKASDYGLIIDYSQFDEFVREQKIADLTDERLTNAIEACAEHINSHADWAVVYLVLRQYYKKKDGMEEFQRRINALKFTKKLVECKDVGKSINSKKGGWMNDHIEKWPSNKQKKFAEAFTKAIESELSK